LRSDFLALPSEEVAAALGGAPQAWYDRAALVALPPEMRRQYVARLRVLLPAGACGLLVSFAYPQEQKQGPPFSVEADEVAALYAEGFEVELLEDADRLAAEPVHREQGLTRLREQVWRLRRV
jgi:thiopurine S-methyltransferase